jgi:hypothetical protein
MFRSMTCLLAVLAGTAACTRFAIPGIWAAPAAQLDHPEIKEPSGLVKSGRFPGLFWTHNDSGDRPRLFALGPDGRAVAQVDVRQAENIDWEDIATDGRSLYLCDIGSARRGREARVIYQLPEPEPRAAAAATVERSFPFSYPSGRTPDAEACFAAADALYVLTKEPGRTALYRIDLGVADRPQVAVKVGQREIDGYVTAADITPDEGTLAVLTYTGVELFRRPRQGDNYLAEPIRRISFLFGQAEAIAWDGPDLIVLNEAGQILRRRGVLPR